MYAWGQASIWIGEEVKPVPGDFVALEPSDDEEHAGRYFVTIVGETDERWIVSTPRSGRNFEILKCEWPVARRILVEPR
jgi:hypothetical protein